MNREPHRLDHLDTFADQIATALAEHGFTYNRRIAGAPNGDDLPARIVHKATRTTLLIASTGILLSYFVTATPSSPDRTKHQSVRLAYTGGVLPVAAMDLNPAVFLARTVTAELGVNDDQLRQAAA